jgi:peptidoglycan/xylan/chitin deacetylase (PgdA/CDA1 family)
LELARYLALAPMKFARALTTTTRQWRKVRLRIPSVFPTILAYHAVGTVQSADDPLRLFLSPDVFAKQMHFLVRCRRVVPLAEAVDRRYERGRPRVAITFDDGYRCLLEHALPVLEECGFPATLFVPTGAIGDRNRWDLDPPPTGLEVMSIEELRNADVRGLAVESHGHAHINLAETSAVSAFDDLAQSVEVLRDVLGRPPRFLAYPWGQVTPEVKDAAARLGFLAAFTIGTRDQGTFARARVPIRRINAPWQFSIQTSGYWPALRFSRIGYPVRAAARAIKVR